MLAMGVCDCLLGLLAQRFELTGEVTYTPIGDVDLLAATSAGRLGNDVLYGVGGEFWLTDTFSVRAATQGDGDVRAWTLGVRYDIGN